MSEQKETLRDFFKAQLEALQINTGLKQYETLSAHPKAKEQIGLLLDSMLIVCKEFSYIPEEDQKRIIQENIIRDQDFQGFNSRVIWKWLNGKKDMYFKELAHQETVMHEPVSEEKKQEYLKLWMLELSKVNDNFKVKTDKYEQQRAARKSDPEYKPLTEQEITTREQHRQYLSAMSATKLPEKDWPDELEWIEQNFKAND